MLEKEKAQQKKMHITQVRKKSYINIDITNITIAKVSKKRVLLRELGHFFRWSNIDKTFSVYNALGNRSVNYTYC